MSAQNLTLIESNRQDGLDLNEKDPAIWTTSTPETTIIHPGDSVMIHSAYLNQIGGGVEDALIFDGVKAPNNNDLAVVDNEVTMDLSFYRSADATNYAFMPAPFNSLNDALIQPFGYCDNYPEFNADSYYDAGTALWVNQNYAGLAFAPKSNYLWESIVYDDLKAQKTPSNFTGLGMGRWQHDGKRYTNFDLGGLRTGNLQNDLAPWRTAATQTHNQGTEDAAAFAITNLDVDNSFGQNLVGSQYRYLLGRGCVATALTGLTGRILDSVKTFTNNVNIPKGVMNASDVATLVTSQVNGKTTINPVAYTGLTPTSDPIGMNYSSATQHEFPALTEPRPIIDTNRPNGYTDYITSLAPDADAQESAKYRTWQYNYWRANRGGGKCFGEGSQIRTTMESIDAPAAVLPAVKAAHRVAYHEQNKAGMTSIVYNENTAEEKDVIPKESLFVKHPELLVAAQKATFNNEQYLTDGVYNPAGLPFMFINGPNLNGQTADGNFDPSLVGPFPPRPLYKASTIIAPEPNNPNGNTSHEPYYIVTNVKWGINNLKVMADWLDEQHPKKMDVMPNIPTQFVAPNGDVTYHYDILTNPDASPNHLSARSYQDNGHRFIHTQNWFDAVTGAQNNATNTSGQLINLIPWSQNALGSGVNIDDDQAFAYRFGADTAVGTAQNDVVANQQGLNLHCSTEPPTNAVRAIDDAPPTQNTMNQGFRAYSGYSVPQYIEYTASNDIRPSNPVTLAAMAVVEGDANLPQTNANTTDCWGGSMYKYKISAPWDTNQNGEYIAFRVDKQTPLLNGMVELGGGTLGPTGTGQSDWSPSAKKFGAGTAQTDIPMPQLFGAETGDEGEYGNINANRCVSYIGWSPTFSSLGNETMTLTTGLSNEVSHPNIRCIWSREADVTIRGVVLPNVTKTATNSISDNIATPWNTDNLLVKTTRVGADPILSFTNDGRFAWEHLHTPQKIGNFWSTGDPAPSNWGELLTTSADEKLNDKTWGLYSGGQPGVADLITANFGWGNVGAQTAYTAGDGRSSTLGWHGEGSYVTDNIGAAAAIKPGFFSLSSYSYPHYSGRDSNGHTTDDIEAWNTGALTIEPAASRIANIGKECWKSFHTNVEDNAGENFDMTIVNSSQTKPGAIIESKGGIFIENWANGIVEQNWDYCLWGKLGYTYAETHKTLSTLLSGSRNAVADNKVGIYTEDLNSIEPITTGADLSQLSVGSFNYNRYGFGTETSGVFGRIYNTNYDWHTSRWRLPLKDETGVFDMSQLETNQTFGLNAGANPRVKIWNVNLQGEGLISITQSTNFTSSTMPRRQNNGYLTIQSDIISDTRFIAGEQGKLPIIAVIPENLATSDYYYGSGDTTLLFTATNTYKFNRITTKVTRPDGRTANLGNRSSVIYRIVRNVIIPPPDFLTQLLQQRAVNNLKENLDIDTNEGSNAEIPSGEKA